MGRKKVPMTESDEEKREKVRQLLQDKRFNMSALAQKLYPSLAANAASAKLANKVNMVQYKNLNKEETDLIAGEYLNMAAEIQEKLQPADTTGLNEPKPIQEPEPEEVQPKRRIAHLFASKEKPSQ